MKREQTEPGHPEKDVALLTQDGITAYLAWLNKKCEREGLLGKEFSINADPLPQASGSTENHNAYVLNVTRVFQVPITVTTNPPGASVFFNNRLIGRTPIEEYVNQVPYVIEIKLPGHATMRRRGLDPQDLYLSLQLEPDKSVVFGSPWTNSLGIKLVPVSGNALVMTHEVRVKDFQEFLKATGRKAPARPGFPQGEDHPVVNVSRQDARAFARWLTSKERALGLIDQHDSYRLPKDEEWSSWVRLTDEQGASPYEKTLPHENSREAFPWGYSWPPPDKTGNFADQSALIYLPSSRVIVGYNDGQPYTAPVKTFPPNHLGLYDLEGNVMEWVDDSYGGPESLPIRNYGVARGGSYLSFRPKQLTTSIRTPLPENTRDNALGFRLILSSERPAIPTAP
ncbi:SUMF1/EgtB/PvdO family nonheme iron enzyme [Akkermansia muciniphila]|nr:SUMF1/EgtB/PvdO family nonheme iron enzyme [Akkermansia muciniphila]